MTATAPQHQQLPEQGLSVTFEPLYVVFVLIFALWTTRTWPGQGRFAEKHHTAPGASTSLLQKVPFVGELGRFVGILILYRISALVCYLIWGLDSSQALANAMKIVRIQTFFFLGDIERDVQGFAWSHPWLMIFLNRVYKHCHIPGTVTFLCYLFATDRNLYRRWILPFSLVNIVAFVVFAVYPCTPPRLIPSLKIIDTMHTAPYGLVNEFQDTRFANQHAAVPSMHIGWSTFVTCGLALSICRRRHRRQQALEEAEQRRRIAQDVEADTTGVDHAHSPDLHDDLPAISDAEFWRRYGPQAEGNELTWLLCSCYSWTMLTSVLATGNHFLLDAVAGLAVVTTAYILTRQHVYTPILQFFLGSLPQSLRAPSGTAATETKETL